MCHTGCKGQDCISHRISQCTTKVPPPLIPPVQSFLPKFPSVQRSPPKSPPLQKFFPQIPPCTDLSPPNPPVQSSRSHPPQYREEPSEQRLQTGNCTYISRLPAQVWISKERLNDRSSGGTLMHCRVSLSRENHVCIVCVETASCHLHWKPVWHGDKAGEQLVDNSRIRAISSINDADLKHVKLTF